MHSNGSDKLLRIVAQEYYNSLSRRVEEEAH